MLENKIKLLNMELSIKKDECINEIKCEAMIDIALRAGALILENGGETYRTEETVIHIAKALGAKTASCFVTPTVIMFSYTDDNDHYHSAIRRITKRTVNLKKISQINELSRRLSKRGKTSNPEQIANLLHRIEKAKEYKPSLIVIMAAFSSFFFAFLFDGTIKEAFVALVIGFILRIGIIFFEKKNLNSFLISLLSGCIVSVLTEIFLLCGVLQSSYTVMIAVLMQVVPGLAIVNAIRDIIAGDFVSGTARIVDAFMIAAGLSVGSVFGMLFFKLF